MNHTCAVCSVAFDEAPGVVPLCDDCYGEHRCRRCGGNGYVVPTKELWEIEIQQEPDSCLRCKGKGYL